jgi:hypothetical protein
MLSYTFPWYNLLFIPYNQYARRRQVMLYGNNNLELCKCRGRRMQDANSIINNESRMTDKSMAVDLIKTRTEIIFNVMAMHEASTQTQLKKRHIAITKSY